MEAGAAGLPLISTQVSGISELVRHRQTGWLVSPGDAVALADAIATLATDPALRDYLSQNARALVETEFSLNTNARRLAELFADVCSQHEECRHLVSLQSMQDITPKSVEGSDEA
jgi:colanic acid/amylovoran biosynthesis glycosyltransferase